MKLYYVKHSRPVFLRHSVVSGNYKVKYSTLKTYSFKYGNTGTKAIQDRPIVYDSYE